MRLFFVRHGQTEANLRGVFCGSSDITLTPEGGAQAQRLAEWLAAVDFISARCSKLQRARDTAQCILGSRSLALYQDAILNEMDFGAWEMRHYAEVQQQDGIAWQAWVDDWQHARPTAGESFPDFQQRVTALAQRLLTDDSRGNHLLVSHQGVLSLLLAQWLSLPPQAMWHFPFQQGAYSVVDIQAGFVTLRALNHTAPWPIEG